MDLPNPACHRAPRHTLRAAIAGLLLICGGALPIGSARAATSPEIWLSPHAGHPPDLPGAADYPTLFQDSNPAWVAITGKFRVFTVSLNYLQAVTDAELAQIATNLHSHNIAMAITIGSVALEPGDTCTYSEGYDTPQANQAFTTRLLRLKVKPDIISMDEPLWFGHYLPTKCRFPVPVLIQRVAANLSYWTAAFPGLTFGDIENWVQIEDNPGWRHDYAQMHDGIEVATGIRLSFVHTDTDIHGHPNWPALLVAAQAFVHQQGMKYGIIYDAMQVATSDAQWIADAKAGIATMETQTGAIPDTAIFASWNPYPSHVLPATNPTTLSGLMLYYLSLPHTP